VEKDRWWLYGLQGEIWRKFGSDLYPVQLLTHWRYVISVTFLSRSSQICFAPSKGVQFSCLLDRTEELQCSRRDVTRECTSLAPASCVNRSRMALMFRRWKWVIPIAANLQAGIYTRVVWTVRNKGTGREHIFGSTPWKRTLKGLSHSAIMYRPTVLVLMIPCFTDKDQSHFNNIISGPD